MPTRSSRLARLAHVGTGARQLLRRAVEHGPVGTDRLAEPRLEVLLRRVGAQQRGARRGVGEALQVGRGDARRRERDRQLGERRAFERAPRDAEQLERGRDVGDGLGANAVIGDEQRGELGNLREAGADGDRISGGGAAHHASRAEGPGGVRRHARERGGEFERVENGD